MVFRFGGGRLAVRGWRTQLQPGLNPGQRLRVADEQNAPGREEPLDLGHESSARSPIKVDYHIATEHEVQGPSHGKGRGGEVQAAKHDALPEAFANPVAGLTARIRALVQKTPVVAINTLDVIGLPPSLPDVRIAAVVNAYRGEIYAAFYEGGKRASDYLLLTPDSFLKMIEDGTTIVGPGVDVVAGAGPIRSGVKLDGSEEHLPTAKAVISMAQPRIKEEDFNDIQFLEPYYIKKTDAERNYAKGNAL